MYRLKPDNHRINLDRKSGRAFLDHEIFTKSHRARFPLCKNSRLAYSKRQIGRLAENSFNWRELSRKKGAKFHSPDARALFGYCPRAKMQLRPGETHSLATYDRTCLLCLRCRYGSGHMILLGAF